MKPGFVIVVEKLVTAFIVWQAAKVIIKAIDRMNPDHIKEMMIGLASTALGLGMTPAERRLRS